MGRAELEADPNLARIFRMAKALALLPAARLQEGVDVLVGMNIAAARSFLDYVQRTWVPSKFSLFKYLLYNFQRARWKQYNFSTR